jgi:hypothetical protein
MKEEGCAREFPVHSACTHSFLNNPKATKEENYPDLGAVIDEVDKVALFILLFLQYITVTL